MKSLIYLSVFAAVALCGCATTESANYPDPEYGTWHYSLQVKDGKYSNPNMEYVPGLGKKLKKLYATTGFYQGIAIVASCKSMQNDGMCGDWVYYLINHDAEIVADFSGFVLPTLSLCQNKYPAIIVLNDVTRDASYDFPMWKSSEYRCGERYLSSKPAFNGGRILVYDKSKDRFGFFDTDGKMVIPPVYKAASPFDERGYARAVDESGFVGMLFMNGQFERDPYVCATALSETHLLVTQSGSIYNYEMDPRLNDGKIYISESLSQIDKENCAGEKVGVAYASSDKFVIPVMYDSIKSIGKDRFYVASVNGRDDYYLKTGEKICSSDEVKDIVLSRRMVFMQNANGKWAFYHVGPGSRTDYIYDEVVFAADSSENVKYIVSAYAGVRTGSKYAILSEEGNLLSSARFDALAFKSDGAGRQNDKLNIVITKQNNKYGVFYDNAELYEPVFDSINEFENGKALAALNGRDYLLFLNMDEALQYYESMHQPVPWRKEGAGTFKHKSGRGFGR